MTTNVTKEEAAALLSQAVEHIATLSRQIAALTAVIEAPEPEPEPEPIVAAPPEISPEMRERMIGTSNRRVSHSLQQALALLVELHGSQSEVCRATGINKTYLSRMVNGIKDNPSDETLAQLGLEAREPRYYFTNGYGQ